MARVLGFGTNVLVIDIEVELAADKFKGHAFRESRYGSFWQVEVTEPVLPDGSPESEYVQEVIKAAAIYEATVYEKRRELEEAVKDASQRLAKKREAAKAEAQPSTVETLVPVAASA